MPGDDDRWAMVGGRKKLYRILWFLGEMGFEKVLLGVEDYHG
jgi:hypothetical protein